MMLEGYGGSLTIFWDTVQKLFNDVVNALHHLQVAPLLEVMQM